MRLRNPFSALVFSLLLLYITAPAQSTGKKLEIGAQFTSLTLYPPDFDGFHRANGTEPGFGGRITYNINDKIAVESELNFFPTNNVFEFLGDGHAIQGHFGVKAGKRFKRLGVFAKARPGFLSIGDVFTVGVGFRLKDPDPARAVSPNKNTGRERTPRYEAGVQFTSISFQPTAPICPDLCIFATPLVDTEPGFGGRFTFNLNSHVALEAEGNFLPRLSRITGGGGHQMLTQFGGKIGKRWTRFGVFGKARPGRSEE